MTLAALGLSVGVLAQSAPPVVGGAPAEAGDWPSVAALYDADGRLFCSGVLIGPEHVLTAGHCGAAPPVKVILDVVDTLGAQGVARGVAQVDVEPAYWEGLDVALIRLDAPVDLDVPPALSGCATNQLYDGAPAELVGFGATQPTDEADGRLYAVTMPVIDADCDDPVRVVERGDARPIAGLRRGPADDGGRALGEHPDAQAQGGEGHRAVSVLVLVFMSSSWRPSASMASRSTSSSRARAVSSPARLRSRSRVRQRRAPRRSATRACSLSAKA